MTVTWENLHTNPSWEADALLPSGAARSQDWASSGQWSLFVPGVGPGARAYSEDAAGMETFAAGDPNAMTPSGIQSITKIMTCIVARAWLTDLGEQVQIVQSDIWSGNRLYVGDVLTVHDLLMLCMVPSDNTAPYVLAREAGTLMLAADSNPAGDPYSRFYEEMQATAQGWGYQGTMFTHAHSRALMSPLQVVGMMRHALADSVLREAMGTREHTVTIVGGPDPRSYAVAHTMFADSSRPAFPEFVAGKTGTGHGLGHVVSAWEHPDSTEHITVIMDTPADEAVRRYVELRRVVVATGGI